MSFEMSNEVKLPWSFSTSISSPRVTSIEAGLISSGENGSTSPMSLHSCRINPAPKPVRGEIVVNEDVTIRVKPGLSDIEQNPLNLILDGTVDFLLNFATW